MVTISTLVEIDFLRRRVVRLEGLLRQLVVLLGEMKGTPERHLEEYCDRLTRAWHDAGKALSDIDVTENLRQAGIVFPELDGGGGR